MMSTRRIFEGIVHQLAYLRMGAEALEGIYPVLKRKLDKKTFEALAEDIVTPEILMPIASLTGYFKDLVKDAQKKGYLKKPAS